MTDANQNCYTFFAKIECTKKSGYTEIYEFLVKICLRISFWWKKVSQDGGAL